VTRPVYDLGFAEFERMVGQTGKTVAPRFYLALGISGSMHHLGGIKDSKKIVAVNLDSKAPIFPNSDEGFVADLRQVLPLLVERVKAAAGGSA
jgi:electron transfer flavoprotein alpha subunit